MSYRGKYDELVASSKSLRSCGYVAMESFSVGRMAGKH